MNTTPASSPGKPSPLTAPSRCDATTRRDAACGPSQAEPSPEQRDAFELALRTKSSRRDDQDHQQDEAQSDAAAAALAAALAAGAPHPLRHATPTATPVSASVETAATGPRAAIEAALNSSSGPIVTPLGATDPAALWEASISEPNGIAVDVRALRGERVTPQAQPTWTVAVSSSTVNADVLARHAPRLNERLRKHGVGLSHVRIESEQDDPE
jgi:hypothetical protein